MTIRFLRALQDGFGEKIHVLSDNASYFKSQRVRDFIVDTAIEVTHFPRGSPDLTPVEECWRQLKRTLGNRFFNSIDKLRPTMIAALDQINPPQITDYDLLDAYPDPRPMVKRTLLTAIVPLLFTFGGVVFFKSLQVV